MQQYPVAMLLVGLVLGFMVMGALRAEDAANASRYQIVAGNYGSVVRLDTRTGQVVGCERLRDDRVTFACGFLP